MRELAIDLTAYKIPSVLSYRQSLSSTFFMKMTLIAINKHLNNGAANLQLLLLQTNWVNRSLLLEDESVFLWSVWTKFTISFKSCLQRYVIVTWKINRSLAYRERICLLYLFFFFNLYKNWISALWDLSNFIACSSLACWTGKLAERTAKNLFSVPLIPLFCRLAHSSRLTFKFGS